MQIYYCIESNCDNIVKGQNRRCCSCSKKGEYNGMYNYNKYNISKQFLIKEYRKNKKSMLKVSNILGCDLKTIEYWLKKYNISIRTLSESSKGLNKIKKYNITKEYLIQEYSKNKKSPTLIAKRLNCSRQVICDRLFQYNISRRTISEANSGKNNGGYINGKGKEPYPLKFNNKLKEQIRKRDNYICQKCGITEEEHLSVYGKVLAVHHIDYNKKNCNDDNLITLCGECNNRVNVNRQYWIKHFQKIIKNKYSMIRNKNGRYNN